MPLPAFPSSARRTAAAALAAILAAGAAFATPPVVPTPEPRLLVAGHGPEGYDVGLEIALPADWHTYWRYPGETGLPPVLSTGGSRNLARLEIAWPAPERYFDGRSSSIVYEGGVVLPLTVVPADPALPVVLEVDLTYGFCKDICVPGIAKLERLLLPGAAGTPEARAAVAASRARVPVPEGEGAPLALGAVERLGPAEGEDGKAAPVLRITATGTAGEGPAPEAELFAEGPDGWALPVPRRDPADPAAFLLPLRGLPRGVDPTGATLRLTLVAGDRAIEAERTVP